MYIFHTNICLAHLRFLYSDMRRGPSLQNCSKSLHIKIPLHSKRWHITKRNKSRALSILLIPYFRVFVYAELKLTLFILTAISLRDFTQNLFVSMRSLYSAP